MEERLEIAGDLGGITLCFDYLKGGSERSLFFCGLTSGEPHSWGTLSVHIWVGQKISKKNLGSVFYFSEKFLHLSCSSINQLIN